MFFSTVLNVVSALAGYSVAILAVGLIATAILGVENLIVVINLSAAPSMILNRSLAALMSVTKNYLKLKWLLMLIPKNLERVYQ